MEVALVFTRAIELWELVRGLESAIDVAKTVQQISFCLVGYYTVILEMRAAKQVPVPVPILKSGTSVLGATFHNSPIASP